MNQILESKKNRLVKKRLYIIQLFIISLIIFLLIIYFSWEKYSENNISKASEATNKSYIISRLYSNQTNSNLIAHDNAITVIGTIDIPKLNISYPIFSQYSEELLKLSICKLYGPNINCIGNLCIIGHNYNNEDFFSKLYLLNIEDIINLYDLNSNLVSYSVFDKYEINPNNLNYLSQETNREKRNNFNYL